MLTPSRTLRFVGTCAVALLLAACGGSPAVSPTATASSPASPGSPTPTPSPTLAVVASAPVTHPPSGSPPATPLSTATAGCDPCFEVTVVRETVGGPWDPTTLTLTALLGPDGNGGFEADGHATGSILLTDWPNEGCKTSAYDGVILMVGAVMGTDLWTTATLTDPFVLDAANLEGLAPLTGGTTHQTQAAQLAPGQQPPVGAGCYAWSTINQTLTVTPLSQ